jgi:CelD/BcsL family acetyltransferase involved in cellulose biosynthesis
MKTHAMSFELLTEFADLQRLEPQWSALIERSAKPEPMQHPAWALTWWKHYNAKRKLAVGVFRDGGEIAGIAPLCQRTFIYRPGIPFRRLELMGASGDEPDGVCGEYLGVTARAGREADVARAFSTALAQRGFGPWDECVLEMMDGDGPMMAPLLGALRTQHGSVASTELSPAYVVSLPTDWETYLNSLHGKRRNWFRRTWKEFQTWVGDRGYALERARTRDDVTAGMRILADLHADRWLGEGQSGVFSSARFMAFHEEFASGQLQAGQLDLLWLTVGGEPVAAHYSFAGGGKVYFYQSGRKMDVPANVRLGIVMFILALQDAMARGLREYDFLGGESAYKPYFTSQTRSLARVRIARSTVREATLRSLRQAAHMVRRRRAD